MFISVRNINDDEKQQNPGAKKTIVINLSKIDIVDLGYILKLIVAFSFPIFIIFLAKLNTIFKIDFMSNVMIFVLWLGMGINLFCTTPLLHEYIVIRNKWEKQRGLDKPYSFFDGLMIFNDEEREG